MARKTAKIVETVTDMEMCGRVLGIDDEIDTQVCEIVVKHGDVSDYEAVRHLMTRIKQGLQHRGYWFYGVRSDAETRADEDGDHTLQYNESERLVTMLMAFDEFDGLIDADVQAHLRAIFDDDEKYAVERPNAPAPSEGIK